MDEVRLAVPARPEFVRLLRTLVASIAARQSLSYDEIDDLRIAVDEASSFLLRLGSQASSLRLTVATGSDSIELVVSSDSDAVAWPPPGVEQTLSWNVLSALTDEAALVRDGGSPALRLTKRATRATSRDPA